MKTMNMSSRARTARKMIQLSLMAKRLTNIPEAIDKYYNWVNTILKESGGRLADGAEIVLGYQMLNTKNLK